MQVQFSLLMTLKHKHDKRRKGFFFYVSKNTFLAFSLFKGLIILINSVQHLLNMESTSAIETEILTKAGEKRMFSKGVDLSDLDQSMNVLL